MARPPPWATTDLCADGITDAADHWTLCCNRTCGTCGGRGCSRRAGGRKACCLAGVVQARKEAFGLLGEYCGDAHDAPCLVRYINVGGNDRTSKRRIDADFWRRKAGNAFPCCRDDGGSCSSPTDFEDHRAAPALRTVFVATPYEGKLQGSAVMRGSSIVSLLNDGNNTTAPVKGGGMRSTRSRKARLVMNAAQVKACGKISPFAADGKGYDVYVHVKFPCQRILAWPGAHVWDLVDVTAKHSNASALHMIRRASHHFAAKLMATTADRDRLCLPNERCFALHHPYNLKCRPRANYSSVGDGGVVLMDTRRTQQQQQARPRLVVGIIGYSKPDPALLAALSSLQSEESFSAAAPFGGIRVVLESEVPRSAPWSAFLNGTAEPLRERRICDFYEGLHVAIAWRPGGPGWPAHGKRLDPSCCYSKPAERFANPLILGIPTIGDAAYASFAELGPEAAEFLCEDVACVLARLQYLAEHGAAWPTAGMVRERWQRLRERVKHDLDAGRLRSRYVATLRVAAAAACQARRRETQTGTGAGRSLLI